MNMNIHKRAFLYTQLCILFYHVINMYWKLLCTNAKNSFLFNNPCYNEIMLLSPINVHTVPNLSLLETRCNCSLIILHICDYIWDIFFYTELFKECMYLKFWYIMKNCSPKRAPTINENVSSILLPTLIFKLLNLRIWKGVSYDDLNLHFSSQWC